MILPDVNVLIYAFRTDNDHHAVCRAWLEAVVSGDARFGISPPVLSAVVRITTDRRIYTNRARRRRRSASATRFLASLIVRSSSPASVIGTSSGASASRRARRARGSPTPGSPRLRSNGAASG
jgi:predicted nucleic acid-binding protein